MGHFLTFFDCNTPEKLWRRAKDVDNCYVKGISGYSDKAKDGSECLAEGLVRVYNKEKIPDELQKYLQNFVLKWSKK